MTPPTPLSLVHQGWTHLQLQRPLAAWASWQAALRLAPDDPAATQALDHLAHADDLPAAARGPYRLRSPSDPARRASWDAALRSAGPDLADPSSAALVFSSLTEQDPTDADALYNLALCLAWSGRNAESISALDRFVPLVASTEPARAADAWTLAEILRHGAGAEHLADNFTSRISVRWPGDPDAPLLWLESSPQAIERPSPPLPDGSPSPRIFEWLDRPMPPPSADLEGPDLPRLRALILVSPNLLRLSTPEPFAAEPEPWNLQEFAQHLAIALGGEADELTSTPLPLPMLDQAVASFRLPAGLDSDQVDRLTREAIEHYFENLWINHPRLGLAGRQPRRAPGAISWQVAIDPAMKARLEGIVRLQEQLAERPTSSPLFQGYPFDRLRRRLGLDPMAPDTLDPSDLSCASSRELSELDLSSLAPPRDLEAWQSLYSNDPARVCDDFYVEMGEMSMIAPWSNGADYTERLAMGMAQESPRQILRDRHLLGDCHGHAAWGRERALAVLDFLAPLIAEGSHCVTPADLLEEKAEVFAWEGDYDAVSSLAAEARSLYPADALLLLRFARLLGRLRGQPQRPPHPFAIPLAEHVFRAAESCHDLPTIGSALLVLDKLRANS
jgi:hypothetical protein